MEAAAIKAAGDHDPACASVMAITVFPGDVDHSSRSGRRRPLPRGTLMSTLSLGLITPGSAFVPPHDPRCDRSHDGAGWRPSSRTPRSSKRERAPTDGSRGRNSSSTTRHRLSRISLAPRWFTRSQGPRGSIAPARRCDSLPMSEQPAGWPFAVAPPQLGPSHAAVCRHACCGSHVAGVGDARAAMEQARVGV